ncbi:12540_t:CDS:2, partial [Dentiscutata heterogama]
PLGQRGTKADFVKYNLKNKYPDQFAPFSIALNETFDGDYNGTIFRYPLRNDRDAAESKISSKQYKTEQVEMMFKTFFQFDNISCLLFLKYIETISFYELKKGSEIPELMYKIEVTNARSILNSRNLLANNIKNKIKSEITYQMEFRQ